MAYEARRGGSAETSGNSVYEDMKAEDARSTANNANNIRNAADVAIASKEPHAAAVGAAVKGADKLTGGKSSEALGKVMTKANKVSPMGRKLQNASNKLNESGASDKIGQSARMASGMPGAGGVPSAGANGAAAGASSTAANAGQGSAGSVGQTGGGQASSSPSSSGSSNRPSLFGDSFKKESINDSDKNDSSESSSSGIGKFFARQAIITMVISVVPFLLIIMLFVVAIATVTGVFSEYEDAFGMSSVLGEETGGLYFTASSPDQQEFYDRINDVKLSYQASGRSLDAMKIVAIYHVLKSNGADIEYKDVTRSVIENWADAMFDGNSYSENVFKNNLINNIFPKYLPGSSERQREEYADDVFDYLNRYYNLIGKDNSSSSSCASIGSCSYDIKGFSIPGRGNVVKNIQISDLKVRLMECGSPYGNGSYNKAIDQDLVNFEDYVAGVAYAEIGDSAPMEAIKTQLVAARSFALSRPSAMGNSAGKKLEQENGQWILQISSCVADQVFCNIDEGCSYMGGGDGQGGIVRSGKVAGAARTRDPLPQDSQIRQAAAETQGEVLVNSQGYIIATGFLSGDQNNWSALAKSGLNYKQILLQSYNQGGRKYGASDVQKMSCNSGDSSSCLSSGEFASWKQYEGPWAETQMGNSGRTIHQIGCLVTSVSMLIAKSGVATPSINPFNPGSFVQFLNSHGGFVSGGNFVWGVATQAAPGFVYKGQISVSGLGREAKLNKIKELVSQPGVYAVAEVKGSTGQHWVAIDGVSGNTVNMLDPASTSNDMWAQYNWANTSTLAYYKVG